MFTLISHPIPCPTLTWTTAKVKYNEQLKWSREPVDYLQCKATPLWWKMAVSRGTLERYSNQCWLLGNNSQKYSCGWEGSTDSMTTLSHQNTFTLVQLHISSKNAPVLQRGFDWCYPFLPIYYSISTQQWTRTSVLKTLSQHTLVQTCNKTQSGGVNCSKVHAYIWKLNTPSPWHAWSEGEELSLHSL